MALYRDMETAFWLLQEAALVQLEGQQRRWKGFITTVRLPPCKSYIEGNLSRVNGVLYDAHERILDEVLPCCECMRAHMMRHLASVISLAQSHNHHLQATADSRSDVGAEAIGGA